MSEEYNQSLPVVYWETFCDLLCQQVDLLTDAGVWQLVLVTGIEPGYRQDMVVLAGVPIGYRPLDDGPWHQRTLTAHIKMTDLTRRVRRIVDSVSYEQPQLAATPRLLKTGEA